MSLRGCKLQFNKGQQMKVAYVSVQQQNEGFDAEIPVSYACIQKQEWKEASENSKTGRPFLPEPAGVCKFFT